MEPVARRSGCYGLPFGLRKAVQLIGPLADRPDARGGDDLVVPDAVDGEFVRLVVLVLEQHVVFRVVRRVLDVRRAVHVAHQMDDVLEVDLHGRIGEAAVVLQVLDGLLQSVDGVAARREHRILVTQFGVHGHGVPVVGELILGGMAVFVHPLGEVDDRVAPEVLLDALFGFFRQIAFGDLGDRLVAFASPSEDAPRVEQAGEEQQ